MSAPERRKPDPWARPADPWLATVDRYAKRGWDLPCDCPCHGHPHVREAAACCGSAGMRYLPGERAYVAWPDGGQP